MNKAIKKAADLLGSQKNLAEKLDVDPSFVSQWYTEHRKIPPTYCKKVEILTGNQVSCEELRPDIFGEPIINEALAS